MTHKFLGWAHVAKNLYNRATQCRDASTESGGERARLNKGQCASLDAIARSIHRHGMVIADEVGMGKTRIVVEVVRAVTEAGGRAAVLIPTGLGFQWHEELLDGHVKAPHVLRSLGSYFELWRADDRSLPPWYYESVVMLTHHFANWRLGERSGAWRWSLLPAIYALWRKEKGLRLPHGYSTFVRDQLDDWVMSSAREAVRIAAEEADSAVEQILDALIEDVEWSKCIDPREYQRETPMRNWLERCVGIGFGAFDLVVIDEAHKSRGAESGLSKLLNNVLVRSNQCRVLAMTATPVELGVEQWRGTLERIDLPMTTDDGQFRQSQIGLAIDEYAEQVRVLKRRWPAIDEVFDDFKNAAKRFQEALSPYVIRRDKREEAEVQEFAQRSGEGPHAYRELREITIAPETLNDNWRLAICAAESCSITASWERDSRAKRARLTFGSGHGIADVMDSVATRDPQDEQQMEDDKRRDSETQEEEPPNTAGSVADSKQQQRFEWWTSVLKSAFLSAGPILFDHPALLAAVNTIEEETQKGQKVLVFGRFTRPMRALVQLLNAREMLRRVADGRPWPQSKVHRDDAMDEWPAVEAAHRQLGSSVNLATLDKTLEQAYESEQGRREKWRRELPDRIMRGIQDLALGESPKGSGQWLQDAVDALQADSGEGQQMRALVARAIASLLGGNAEASTPSECARAFIELLEAAGDRDAEGDEASDDGEPRFSGPAFIERLKEEFDTPQGTFARLMYGGTKVDSRRMIQLAFNRTHGFPSVLVAQSLVGREGLNLHKACRVVVLLHPEWNPGVVEQQIGRVDRVGSRWSRELAACPKDVTAKELPRIEVRPIVFKGTYDEYNWSVLKDRWEELRAQLHGMPIPYRLVTSEKHNELIKLVEQAAPSFSPFAEGDVIGGAAP